jgi:hypothetical protein
MTNTTSENNYLIKVYCLGKLIHTKELSTFDDVCTHITYLKGMKQVFEKIEIYHKEILLTTWKFQKK